jgi:Amt family ammonium transporter
MVYQGMFAIITPALITGAFAERVRFGPYLAFVAIWSLVVYAPIAPWVFAYDGWLNTFTTGASPDVGINGLDFAGGLAIHINAGIAALAAVLIFGKRKGYGSEPMEAHDVTMVVLGAALLWFGWFGFNAGSAGAANGQAATAFVNTNVAAAAAALTWTLASWKVSGKPGAIGAAAGAVAGLVAITPASGYVQPMEALAIGVAAGAICYGAVILRAKMRFDDSLDVIPVHGVGGLVGTVATGLFATAAVGAPAFREGLFISGDWALLRDQLIGVLAVGAYSFAVTFAILKVLDVLVGVRVSEEDEELGLDLSQHGERAYSFNESGTPVYGLPAAGEPGVASMESPRRTHGGAEAPAS